MPDSTQPKTTTPDDALIGKLTVEFIGTFFLVLTISMVVIKAADLSIVAPLAIGFTLTAMVYAFGPISGAHFNPAVTIGLYLTGRCPRAHVGPYIVAECLGGVTAAVLALYMRGEAEAMLEAVPTAGFVAEAVWTFLLVFVIHPNHFQPRGRQPVVRHRRGLHRRRRCLGHGQRVRRRIQPSRVAGPRLAGQTGLVRVADLPDRTTCRLRPRRSLQPTRGTNHHRARLT